MSGTARILERLRQGPATAAELYGLHCIVHSRVADLRKQGHRIVCEHTEGETGPGSYVYRLDPLSDRGRGATAATAAHPSEHGDGFSPDAPQSSGQLCLIEAAA